MDKFSFNNTIGDKIKFISGSTEVYGCSSSSHQNQGITSHVQLVRKRMEKRRGSLDYETTGNLKAFQNPRRLSVDNISSFRYALKSIHSEKMVNRKNSCSSVDSYSCSVEPEEVLYDPRRRSSLGAESLIEGDIDDDHDIEDGYDLPIEALLGLQYVEEVFDIKRLLEQKYHPLKCLSNQTQVRM